MNNKSLSKVIAILLSVALAVSVTPLVAFAQETAPPSGESVAGEPPSSAVITIVPESEYISLSIPQGKPVTDAALLKGVSAVDKNGDKIEVTVIDYGGLDLGSPQPKGEPGSPEAYVLTYAAEGAEAVTRDCFVTVGIMRLDTDGDYEYNVSGGRADITGYTGSGGDIVIPDTLGGYPVAMILADAFENCVSLTGVVIPEGVSTIATDAFTGCSNLTSVTLPDSLRTILITAFEGCSSLTSVIIPANVRNIANAAFRGCTGLENITFEGAPPQSMGSNVFVNISPDANITVPEGMEEEYESALAGAGLTDLANQVTAVNNPPFLKTGVSASVSASVSMNEAYTLDLATIFEDVGTASDLLTFTVAVDGAAAVAAEQNYSYTPTAAGTVTLVFKADDGSNVSADTYTVTLAVTAVKPAVTFTAQGRVNLQSPTDLVLAANNTLLNGYTFAAVQFSRDVDSPGVVLSDGDYGIGIKWQDGKLTIAGAAFATHSKPGPPPDGGGQPALTPRSYIAKITFDDDVGGFWEYDVPFTLTNIPVTVAVTSVTLNKSALSLTEDSSETLIATVLPENATNKGVTWSSNNSSVATVDASGKVTAVSVGTATITVTTNDGGHTASCVVTVTEPGTPPADTNVTVTGVTLNKSALSLAEDSSETLIATVLPTNATNKGVTWSSNNPSVATVDANGKVIAVSVGTATITVTTNDGGHTASCVVTVTEPGTPPADTNVAVTGVTLNKFALSLAEDSSETLIATVLPTNATNKGITWSSNNPSVATVDASGKVTAVSAGTATITVTTNDGGHTASCVVTVTEVGVPQTGDSSNMAGWVMALLASGLGIIVIVAVYKKRRSAGMR